MVTELIRNPRSYLGRQRRKYTELLLNPDSFYENRVSYTGTRNEFLLLFVVGIVGTIGMVFANQTILENFVVGAAPGQQVEVLDQDTHLQLWGKAIHPIAGIFVLWFLYTTAFYAISWLYTERGTYFSILKNVAWGFLPMLFYNALYSIALIVAFWDADIETDLPSGRSGEIIAYLLDQGRNEPVVVAAGIIGLVFLAWSGYIWSYAIKHARNLDHEDAIKVVAIPVAIHAVYLLWTLLDRAIL